MPFAKGQSGNPGGRPRVVAEVRDLAREHTPMAIATLAEIAQDTEQDPRARVQACAQLLDRGYGKPPQSLSVDPPAEHVRRIVLCHDITPSHRPANGQAAVAGNGSPTRIVLCGNETPTQAV